VLDAEVALASPEVRRRRCRHLPTEDIRDLPVYHILSC